MHKIIKMISVILLLVVLIGVNAPSSNANPAPPPSIVIIVLNAPADLEIVLHPQIAWARRENKGFESYFFIYLHDLKTSGNFLQVTTEGKTFEIAIPDPSMRYLSFFTLDLGSRTLIPGKSLSRNILAVSIRVILTFILEGLVFFLFGYRRLRSWLVFLLVNLLTQVGLNIWLDMKFLPWGNFVAYWLFLGELAVIGVEIVAFSVFVNERSRLRTILYVILANLLSLILGGYLLTVLPL